MSPKAKHIPDDARRTSICLSAEENAAINWISEARRIRKESRWTMNCILVDALWYFLERTEGKTKDHMREMIPTRPPDELQSKVTEMPKPKNNR